MTTNEERREVAAKLREKSKETEDMRNQAKDDFLTPTMVDRNLYSTIRMRAIRSCIGQGDIFERLADLIDRPVTHRACKNPSAIHEKWPCERCGYSIKDKRWRFCPKCGAEVVE